MKIIKRIILTILIIVLVGFAILAFGFYFLTLPVSNESIPKDVVIENEMTINDIAVLLEENSLIKNKYTFKILMKLKKENGIYAAKYSLNENMSTYEIIEELEKGGTNTEETSIEIQEGLNIKQIAKVISENTNNTEEDVLNTMKDNTYVSSLIEKYWFITDDILNTELYYPLEGYLYPDTYNISSKDAKPEEIITTMLDQMGTVLDDYKTDVENSKYSIHELLTMASITELEGTDDASRKGIAGVLYNRLNEGMSLGSDVTTYYGAGISMSERDLTESDLASENPYNTSSNNPSMAGKLPVGPICSPSKTAIEAAIKPEENDYLYFVADKNGEVYFTKTYAEHEAKVEQLVEDGLWYEW